ncbi:21856_t:CDS:2 [Rhizophagus irregularis]|nr:21856_t:CDS:2 [Rhizophagus irregularis]
MVFPKLTGHIKKDTISEKICRNYMYLWGYKYDERKKGGYYNGHERPDVVKYRKKWLKRMFKYQRLMKDFNSDMMNIVSEPQLKPGDKELQRIWMREDEDILRSKHQGRSIMVSAFLYPCYKLLQLSDEQMQENLHIKSKEAFILHSVQTDGYWKSEHMLDQLMHQAIPIFEILHPSCVADALIAVRMNLSSRGAQSKMRDGWYINENEEKLVHSMVFPDNHKLKEKLKGIKQVPEVLICVSVTTICKFACKSWRYMDAYNKGLEGRTAE